MKYRPLIITTLLPLDNLTAIGTVFALTIGGLLRCAEAVVTLQKLARPAFTAQMLAQQQAFVQFWCDQNDVREDQLAALMRHTFPWNGGHLLERARNVQSAANRELGLSSSTQRRMRELIETRNRATRLGPEIRTVFVFGGDL